MPVQVQTNDASTLTDSDLDDFASMGGAFGIGELSKAKEDWVLITTARIDAKLHGFTFSTLERIGGTPCVLLGLMSVKRTSKRDQVLRALMERGLPPGAHGVPRRGRRRRRPLRVGRRARRVQGARRRDAAPGRSCGRRGTGLGPSPRQAFRRRGRPTTSRRSCARRRVRRASSTTSHAKPEKIEAGVDGDVRRRRRRSGGTLVVYGWTMAEDLVKLGAPLNARRVTELADVIRGRRMTRAFRPDPLPDGLLEHLVDLASRAPSAGKTQGWHLVVLAGSETARFWDARCRPIGAPHSAGRGCSTRRWSPSRSPTRRPTSTRYARARQGRRDPMSQHWARAPTRGRRRTGPSMRRWR